MIQFARRPRRKPFINLTSLIDVMFLLLLFLVVTTRFVDEPSLRLDLPTAKQADTVKPSSLDLVVTGDKQIFLNGQPVKQKDLGGRIRAIIQSDGDQLLLLRGDKEISYGLLVSLIDTAKQNGVRRFAMVTRPPRE